MDQDLIKKRNKFLENFQESEKIVKKRVHYNSVLNFSKALISDVENDSIGYKEKLNKYFDEVFDSKQRPINKLESLRNYQTYLHEIALYLMKTKGFRSPSDLRRAVIGGSVLDIVLFYLGILEFLFYVPLFTIFFVILALNKRKKAIMEDRYFNRSW